MLHDPSAVNHGCLPDVIAEPVANAVFVEQGRIEDLAKLRIDPHPLANIL